MIYHGLNDKRLKTVTFPFEDGSHPTYYIPAEASDLINNSTVAGATVKEALETIDGKTLAILPQKSANPGSIVTFEDGADDIPLRHLEFDVECTQDLHGYDNPWPGGSGKNLLDPGAIEVGAYSTNGFDSEDGDPVYRRFSIDLPAGVYTFSTTLTNAYLIRSFIGGVLTSVPNNAQPYTFTIPEDGTFKLSMRNSSSTEITEAFTCQIESGSEATTYAPYENICPITGYTGSEASVTGKNLLDINAVHSGSIDSGTGQEKTSTTTKITPMICVFPETTYFLSVGGASPSLRPHYYKKNGDYLGNGIAQSNASFTTPSECGYVRIIGTNAGWTYSNYQLELGSTATDYEPFGHTYSISFPSEAGTVYSGHVTVEKDGSGILVVDMAKKQILSVNAMQSTTKYGIAKIEGYGNVDTSINQYSNLLSYNDSGSPQDMNEDEFMVINSSGYNSGVFDFKLKDADTYGSISWYNERLAELASAGTPLEVVYGIVSPVVYTLDPVQVKSLLGLNNVWVNTGDITDLTYYVGGEYKDAEDKRDIIEATIPYDTAAGAIATFPDGADNVRLKQLSVDINPVQDLHGYDNPWPAGGGKNLFDKTAVGSDNKYLTSTGGQITPSDSAQWRISDYIPVVPGQAYTISGMNGTGGSTPGCRFYSADKSEGITGASYSGSSTKTVTAPENAYWLRISVTYDTLDIAQVELGSEATSYAPYSNICPISGYTECNIYAGGGNYTHLTKNKTINAETGAYNTSASAEYYCTDMIPLIDGEGIYIKFKQQASGARVFARCWFDQNGNFISGSSRNIGATGAVDSYFVRVSTGEGSNIIPDTAKYMVFSFGKGANGTLDYAMPYLRTYPITFPSGTTVYGGNLTVNRDGSGSLVVTHRVNTYTGGFQSAGGGFYYVLSAYTVTYGEEILCNQYKPFSARNVSPTDLPDCSIYLRTSYNRITLRDTRFSTQSDFNAYLADNPLEVYMRLATPITIPLTASQITTLLGTNNIWSDANGSVNVNYPCDVGLYITKKLEELVGGNG